MLRPTLAVLIQLEGALFGAYTTLHQVFLLLRVKKNISQCLSTTRWRGNENRTVRIIVTLGEGQWLYSTYDD